MKKAEVIIDGITYIVRVTTDDGVKSAIKQLKKSIKDQKKREEE